MVPRFFPVPCRGCLVWHDAMFSDCRVLRNAIQSHASGSRVLNCMFTFDLAAVRVWVGAKSVNIVHWPSVQARASLELFYST